MAFRTLSEPPGSDLTKAMKRRDHAHILDLRPLHRLARAEGLLVRLGLPELQGHLLWVGFITLPLGGQ